MSKSILLDTRTSTYLELIGNGKRYRVPPFQRDYAWGEEQWEDLWTDIVALKGDEEARHYFGTLVVEPTADRESLIIDGQQRLATLSILALAIIGRLRHLAAAGTDAPRNEERAETLRNQFIGHKNPASLVVTSKLKLNEAVDSFYQDQLVAGRDPSNPRGLAKSTRALWECMLWFRRQLEADPLLANDGEAMATLLDETVGNQLLFIVINVQDELSAYTIFETLNARGVELSATDLLKNYLFSRVRVRSDQEVLQRRWRKVVETVRAERFPDFLRYHLGCEHPRIRSQRLFKLVRDKVRDADEVFALMDALDARAEVFAALNDASHEFWSDRPEALPFVRELLLLRFQQMTPLLFAGWEKFSATDFARLLRTVVVVTFRHGVVCRRNPNELEPVYHAAARDVLGGTARTVADVFASLRPIYVDDETFRRTFERWETPTTGQRKHLARYVLARLESDLSGRACDFETDPATVEHILPEHPSEEWDATFPANRQANALFRVGNLTLLEASLNRALGSAGFAAKREVYGKSSFALTQAISTGPEDWSPAVLDARQAEMARRAAHVWRVDA